MNHRYLEFEGKLYDIGTKVLINPWGDEIYEATFAGWCRNRPAFEGKYLWLNRNNEVKVIKILEPVEINIDINHQQNNNSRNYPFPWEVEMGWIWYIIIMLVGVIFNDRLMIWIVATVVFFSWKNGFLGGKK